MSFNSEIIPLGGVSLPQSQGTRIMMMPFEFGNIDSIPEEVDGQPLSPWRPVVGAIISRLHDKGLNPGTGIGYLTIDEAHVARGTTHRRPGLHVDGVGPNGSKGPWGGGNGPWGAGGMVILASHAGSRGWSQVFEGVPGNNGDCQHLADQLSAAAEIIFSPNQAFWCGPLAVHESLQLPNDTDRQFCRVSLPSDAPWYEGYTQNPLGVQPGGPIHAPRTAFMAYRP